MSAQRYISVRDWRTFQHYDPAKRAPAWIKQYTELLHDDAYMSLPVGTALVLHRLWLEYASTRCRLAVDTASLSRRLGVRVTKQTLKTLNHAGFIDFVASTALADGYQSASTPASPEVEVRRRKDSPKPPHQENGKPVGDIVALVEHQIRNGGFQLTDGSLLEEFEQKGAPGDQHVRLLELVNELRAARSRAESDLAASQEGREGGLNSHV